MTYYYQDQYPRSTSQSNAYKIKNSPCGNWNYMGGTDSDKPRSSSSSSSSSVPNYDPRTPSSSSSKCDSNKPSSSRYKLDHHHRDYDRHGHRNRNRDDDKNRNRDDDRNRNRNRNRKGEDDRNRDQRYSNRKYTKECPKSSRTPESISSSSSSSSCCRHGCCEEVNSKHESHKVIKKDSYRGEKVQFDCPDSIPSDIAEKAKEALQKEKNLFGRRCIMKYVNVPVEVKKKFNVRLQIPVQVDLYQPKVVKKHKDVDCDP